MGISNELITDGVFDGIRRGRWATDAEFKNIWHKRPGVVIGRGPNDDYKRFQAVAQFAGKRIGCNTAFRAYLNLDAIVWMDYEIFRDHKEEMRHLKCYKFAVNPVTYRTYGIDIIGLKAMRPERCSDSIESGFYPCNLTGYVGTNLALIMGLDPVWLHGFDSNYKDPMMRKRVDQFAYIADWCRQNDRHVYIATEGSYLERFFEHKKLPGSGEKRLRARKKGVNCDDMGNRGEITMSAAI